MNDRGIEHVGQPHVDGKDRLPGDLVVQVETPARRAGELPIARILQRDIGRRLDLGGAVGDGAEGHAAAARGVGDDAVLRAHSEAGTFQRNAAAAISISRAVAPARRK